MAKRIEMVAIQIGQPQNIVHLVPAMTAANERVGL
jgi:hypothetical protein